MAKSVPLRVARPPTTRELNALLGDSYAAFQALTQRGSAVTREWRRYNKTSPWVLKVSQGERTLFYATPKVGSFEATVVLGKRATEAALQGGVSRKLHASIRAAPAYAEGRPVRRRRQGSGRPGWCRATCGDQAQSHSQPDRRIHHQASPWPEEELKPTAPER